jgi:HEAT repeat protein
MPATSARDLAALLDSLSAGAAPASAQLSLLSDLDREETRLVRARWGAIPERLRVDVLTRALEVAEDNVDLAFESLATVALDDPSAEVRRRASRGLWESSDRAVAARLRALLAGDPDDAVRAAAATSLRLVVHLRELDQFDQTEGDAVVEALRAALDDPAAETSVRAAALESVGARSLPWVHARIAEEYNAEDRRMRIAAVRAMGDNADERWLDYLHEQFYADDPAFRFEAAVAVGGVASEDSVERLQHLLDDDDLQVVVAAVEALAEIGNFEAVESMEAYARRAPDEIVEAVRTAIETARELGVAAAAGDTHGDTYEDEE